MSSLYTVKGITKLLTPSVPAAPAAPDAPNYDNYVDEISGVQRKRVLQPDGTYTVVQSAIPLSAEEQAAANQLKTIAQDNLTRYKDLVENYDVSQIPGLADTIKNYTDYANNIVNKSFDQAQQSSEKQLGRAGLGDSTAAVQQRRGTVNDRASALTSVGQNAYQLEQNQRQQEINNVGSLYQLATGQQQQTLQNQLAGAQLGQTTQSNLAALQQQANLAAYQGALGQQGLQYQAQQAGLSNLSALAGLGISAATGNPAGGFSSLSKLSSGGGASSGLTSSFGAPSSTFNLPGNRFA